jgi:DnaJ-class molecular chaperone
LSLAESTEGPSTEEVKMAFKTQAMLMHPDRFISAPEDERKQVTEQTREKETEECSLLNDPHHGSPSIHVDAESFRFCT